MQMQQHNSQCLLSDNFVLHLPEMFNLVLNEPNEVEFDQHCYKLHDNNVDFLGNPNGHEEVAKGCFRNIES